MFVTTNVSPTTMASAREAAGLKQAFVDKKGNYFLPEGDKLIHAGAWHGKGTSQLEKDTAAKIAKMTTEVKAAKAEARKAEIEAAVAQALKEAETNQEEPTDESSWCGSLFSSIGSVFKGIWDGFIYLITCCGCFDSGEATASEEQTEAQSAAK